MRETLGSGNVNVPGRNCERWTKADNGKQRKRNMGGKPRKGRRQSRRAGARSAMLDRGAAIRKQIVGGGN